MLPCPQVDFTGGFNAFFGAAYGLVNSSIEATYGTAFGMTVLEPQIHLDKSAYPANAANFALTHYHLHL